MPPMPLRLTSSVRMLSEISAAQPFQLQLARSALHPADDFVHRAPGLLDGEMRAGNHRAHEALHRLGPALAANAGLTITAKP